jgi:hypothetical protein
MASLTPASLRVPGAAGIPRVDDLGPQIVDAEVPPAGRFGPPLASACLAAMDHGPQMHLLLLPVVAVALLGWLAYVVVRRVNKRGRSDRDQPTDPKPDERDRSPEP